MTTHAEQRNLPYTPLQLFTLVAEVDKYPAFLPWCLASRITERDGDVFYADLVIGYKMLREKFSSRVTALKPDHIHVEYLDGPMQHLSNHWRFLEEEDGSCTIDFYVEFEFKNKLLQSVIETFFNEAVKKMVNAFEKRANELYVPLKIER
ncbi:MAG: type II toxin-antitoxin system RatA family toxin [Alphaproteobacteria bacterium]|jgi:coenzyme Q-binding protein COQ10|nr:type II toxin-antitoxin system RatA family toxin [Alphaproteobacteria bacterium]MDP7222698.1 type II toxin-antitoxin system RatA family toxin [Alphaproteobacteria bacterium]